LTMDIKEKRSYTEESAALAIQDTSDFPKNK
jgi:hypothetical protein